MVAMGTGLTNMHLEEWEYQELQPGVYQPTVEEALRILFTEYPDLMFCRAQRDFLTFGGEVMYAPHHEFGVRNTAGDWEWATIPPEHWTGEIVLEYGIKMAQEVKKLQCPKP